MIKLTPEGETLMQICDSVGWPLAGLGLSIRDMADLGIIEPLPPPLTGDELRVVLEALPNAALEPEHEEEKSHD